MARRNLFESLDEVGGRIDRAGSILIGLDFDGTLAPIRPRPGEAVLEEPVRAVLARLDRLPRVDVMIASGRSLADVRSRVGLPQLIYSGNHGLEIHGRGLTFVEPVARAAAAPLHELCQRAETLLASVPGVVLEQKGLTASVHYRTAATERWDEIAQIARHLVASDPDRFVLSAGHRIWEIRPRVAWHKGKAVNWVVEHLEDPRRRLVFYIGDDRTDEDAFASLPDGITVNVGRGAPSQARYELTDPAAVELFLRWLLEKLSPPEEH
jgi:trehalose 6-phosphate phosphatase